LQTSSNAEYYLSTPRPHSRLQETALRHGWTTIVSNSQTSAMSISQFGRDSSHSCIWRGVFQCKARNEARIPISVIRKLRNLHTLVVESNTISVHNRHLIGGVKRYTRLLLSLRGRQHRPIWILLRNRTVSIVIRPRGVTSRKC
jgi:hypothetical protein